LRIAIAGLVLAAAALAQPGETDVGELAAYTGFAAGGLGTHPLVGGSGATALSRYLLAQVDASWVPLGRRTLRSYPGIATTQSNLYDFNCSVQIRVPVRKRWAPYAILGAGVLYNPYHIQALGSQGAIYLSSQSDTAFGFETGGGVRYYVANNWGVRGEYRYTISSRNFSRLVGGVFYQFNGPGSFPFRARSWRTRRLPYPL
jgi:hypothetical protein